MQDPINRQVKKKRRKENKKQNTFPRFVREETASLVLRGERVKALIFFSRDLYRPSVFIVPTAYIVLELERQDVVPALGWLMPVDY